MLFAGWEVRMVKNCDRGLENAVFHHTDRPKPANNMFIFFQEGTVTNPALPSACGLWQHFQALGHSFSPYGPPSQQITYMYRVDSNNM